MKKFMASIAALILCLGIFCGSTIAKADASGYFYTTLLCSEDFSNDNCRNDTKNGALFAYTALSDYWAAQGSSKDVTDAFNQEESIYVCGGSSKNGNFLKVFFWRPDGHCFQLFMYEDVSAMLFYNDSGMLTSAGMRTALPYSNDIDWYYELSSADVITAGEAPANSAK